MKLFRRQSSTYESTEKSKIANVVGRGPFRTNRYLHRALRMPIYEHLQSSSLNDVGTLTNNSQESINGRIHKLNCSLDSNDFFFTQTSVCVVLVILNFYFCNKFTTFFIKPLIRLLELMLLQSLSIFCF